MNAYQWIFFSEVLCACSQLYFTRIFPLEINDNCGLAWLISFPLQKKRVLHFAKRKQYPLFTVKHFHVSESMWTYMQFLTFPWKILSFYWHMFLGFISMCFSFVLIVSILQHAEFWWSYSLRTLSSLSLIHFTGSFNKEFMTVMLLLLLKLLLKFISVYLVV